MSPRRKNAAKTLRGRSARSVSQAANRGVGNRGNHLVSESEEPGHVVRVRDGTRENAVAQQPLTKLVANAFNALRLVCRSSSGQRRQLLVDRARIAALAELVRQPFPIRREVAVQVKVQAHDGFAEVAERAICIAIVSLRSTKRQTKLYSP